MFDRVSIWIAATAAAAVVERLSLELKKMMLAVKRKKDEHKENRLYNVVVFNPKLTICHPENLFFFQITLTLVH